MFLKVGGECVETAMLERINNEARSPGEGYQSSTHWALEIIQHAHKSVDFFVPELFVRVSKDEVERVYQTLISFGCNAVPMTAAEQLVRQRLHANPLSQPTLAILQDDGRCCTLS